MGIMSRTEVAASAGRDFEDTLAQLQAENELLKQYGIAVEQVEPQEVNNDQQDD